LPTELVMKKVVKNTKSATKNVTVAEDVKNVAASEATPAASATPPAVATPVPTVVAKMTDPAVKECNTLLDQVLGKLGDQAPLDADQVRRSTKMRKGGAEVIPKILALCLQHGVTSIGSLTTTEMSDELARGDALVQVGLRSALVQKKVKDAAMAAHGRSWQIGTTMYSALQRMANDDPELALGVQEVQSFFQTKKTKGKKRENKKVSLAKKAAKAAGAATAAAPPAATNDGVATAPAVNVAPAAPPPPLASGGAAH
jgi:hypothetical protein